MGNTRIVACLLGMLAGLALTVAQAAGAGEPGWQPAALKVAKAKPAKKPEPPAQSTITFFWPGTDGSLFSVFREKLLLTVDGKAAGKLTQGEYISIPVDPGHHTYGYERDARLSEGETKREIDIPAGQSLFFEIVEQNEAGFLHRMYPQQVALEEGQAQIAKLKAPLQVASKEVIPGVPAAPVAPGVPAATGPAVSSAAVAQPGGKPGKKGAPQPVQQSYITFYWPKRSAGFLSSLRETIGVSIDGQVAGSIGEGEYVSVPVQPGPHIYTYAKSARVNYGEKKHEVNVLPGQSAFFEIAEEQQGMVTVTYPQEVAPEQGRQALAGLKQPEN